MALPAPVQELWNVWREIEGTANRAVSVNLYGPAGEPRNALKAMLLQHGNRPAALRVLDLPDGPPPDADVHLMMVDTAFGPAKSQVSVLRQLAPKSLVFVLVGLDGEEADSRRREVATAVGARVDQVVAAKTASALRPLLAARLVGQFEELMVPLARALPFLRDEAANHEIRGTSQQNAMVGVIPIPGADMPIMTANQIKMVMRIAAIWDQPMTVERAKEVMAVVGSGFALRTAARQVAKFIPGPGWIVGGVLGFGGTMAMGRAAVEYFRRTSDGSLLGPRTSSDEGGTVIEADATVVDPPERR